MPVRAPDQGVHAYIGAPQTGKTFLAHAEFLAYCAARRCGGIVVDIQGAKSFRKIRHVPTLRDAVSIAWNGGVAYWTPSDESEIETLFLAIKAAENASRARTHLAVFLDEVGTLPKSQALETAFRCWSHRDICLFTTSQKVTKDLGETILACEPVIRLFRFTAPSSIKVLTIVYRIPWERVETFGEGWHCVIRSGVPAVVCPPVKV